MLNALENSTLSRDDPVWEAGMCSGVAMEWITDRIYNSEDSSEERIARLNSNAGVHQAAETNKIGSDEYLVAGSLNGSLIDANTESMKAMLAPKNVELIGDASFISLSDRNATKNIANIISNSGHYIVNIYDMRPRNDPHNNQGHMLAVCSENDRMEIFDGNYGEYNIDIHDAEKLLKQIIGNYSRNWRIDNLMIQKVY